jgi:filamentous hemagglutinin
VKLPNADQAVVEREKVVSYLLNSAHPDNGGKAAFFELLGFTRVDWRTLAEALRRVGIDHEVSLSSTTAHGTKYVVDGEIAGPKGRTASVRTVWIVEGAVHRPRLVTAYPHQEKN